MRMREYHVDMHKDLESFVNNREYGGDLSVRIGVNY